jgi:hypothetical protein
VCVCVCARGPMRHMQSVDQITPLHVKERKTCAPNNTRVPQARAPRIARARSPRGRNASRERMCGCWNLTFLLKMFCSVLFSGDIFWARCGRHSLSSSLSPSLPLFLPLLTVSLPLFTLFISCHSPSSHVHGCIRIHDQHPLVSHS